MKIKMALGLIGLLYVFFLAGCISSTSEDTTIISTTSITSIVDTSIDTLDELENQLQLVYDVLFSAGTYTGSYEEWNASIDDFQNQPGVTVIGVGINESNHIIIRYSNAATLDLGVIKIAHLVQFKDLNGFVIDVQLVLDGENAVEPEAPTIVGYNFLGWDIAFTNIHEDTIVCAEYSRKVVHITFNSQGGTAVEILPSVIFYYGDVIYNLPVTTKTNSIFEGWYLGLNEFSQPVYDGYVLTGDVTLYAHWSDAEMEPNLP